MKPWSKLRSLLHREKIDAEMSEEMRLHLELQIERERAAGMTAEEARYAARRRFGHIEGFKEQCRDQRRWMWLENATRDLRFAGRSLRRAPAFSLAVIATLALCIGPNTAILTVLYALMLKPQPFHEPERVVQIYNVFEKLGGGRSRQESSVPQYRDFKASADLFADFAMMRYVGATMGEGLAPERVAGMRVNAGFFDFLGVRPLLGRFGTKEEEIVGRDHVLVLTQSFWESHFNADPAVVGQEVRLSGETWTIIGVAPRSVERLDVHTQFFKPFESVANEENAMAARYVGKTLLFGRLKAGVSRVAALEQLKTIDRRFLTEQGPAAMRAFFENAGHQIAVGELGEQIAGTVRTPLSLLQAGAAFVLLIGLVNVVNLMLARIATKRPELAIRHALGAGRLTLLRQLLAESLLLTTVATALGVGLAWACLKVINGYLPLIVFSAPPVSLEPAMAGPIAGISLGLALVVGLVPFALSWRSGLKLTEVRTASGGGVRFFSSTLVVVQVAIALWLLVCAGLLVRSFAKVVATDPGFDVAHLVQGRVAAGKTYDAPETNLGLQRRVIAGMQEIPGVEKAALAFDYALAGSFRPQPFVRRGEAINPGENRPLVAIDLVSPEFFDTMGMRLLEGRLFTEADGNRNAPVVVVDDLFAQRYFPGRSAVGQELNPGATPPAEGRPWARVVGVVRRAQLTGLEARDGMPIVFVPMIQQFAAGFSFIVRSPRPTGDILVEMRRKLREIDPALPLYSAGSLEDGLDSMLGNRRGITLLIGAFAALALVLAGVGLYGVLAYDVSQRTREIGIRGAIGATRAQIVGMILRQGLWKSALGLAAGLAGGAYATRFIRGLLFDVEPFDPLAFGGVSLLMLGVAGLACWLPARRAAKVDPMVALRCE